jgi:uncharacterized DUF497 family protein
MTDIKETFDCTGFEWDQSNVDKNLVKHNVTHWECEQVFFNGPLIILDDLTHSVTENRYAAFGQTDDGRLLAVIFTKRGELLRVISARDMSRGERKFYEQNK